MVIRGLLKSRRNAVRDAKVLIGIGPDAQTIRPSKREKRDQRADRAFSSPHKTLLSRGSTYLERILRLLFRLVNRFWRQRRYGLSHVAVQL